MEKIKGRARFGNIQLETETAGQTIPGFFAKRPNFEIAFQENLRHLVIALVFFFATFLQGQS